MPRDTGKKIEFKNHNRMIKVPFVVYADFDSIIKPINACEPSDEKSFTNQYQKHVSCRFSDKIVCFDDDIWSQDPVGSSLRCLRAISRRFTKNSISPRK